MTRESDHHLPGRPRRRSAEGDGDAQDHVGGGGRRASTRSKASCSCTICGGRRCFEGGWFWLPARLPAPGRWIWICCFGFAEERSRSMTLPERIADLRLLLFDVDGVLTDGVVIMHADGSEAKGFHIRDGAAMVWAQRAGLTIGLLSARSSGATTHRAAQLGDPAGRAGRVEQTRRLRTDPARHRARAMRRSPTWETICWICRS